MVSTFYLFSGSPKLSAIFYSSKVMDSSKTLESESKKYAICDSEQIVINNFLDDYSLIHIFKYLSSPERLKIEYVCKRWQRLSKRSWKNVKLLTVYETTKIVNTNYINSVIRRSGNYLLGVKITTSLKLSYTFIFKELQIIAKILEPLL